MANGVGLFRLLLNRVPFLTLSNYITPREHSPIFDTIFIPVTYALSLHKLQCAILLEYRLFNNL